MKKLAIGFWIAYTIALTLAAVWPCPCGCNEFWCKMTKDCISTNLKVGQHPCQKAKQ
jgi:hypothetical protein